MTDGTADIIHGEGLLKLQTFIILSCLSNKETVSQKSASSVTICWFHKKLSPSHRNRRPPGARLCRSISIPNFSCAMPSGEKTEVARMLIKWSLYKLTRTTIDVKWKTTNMIYGNDKKCLVVKRYERFEKKSCVHLQCQEDPDLI